jgi:hypothetical protein
MARSTWTVTVRISSGSYISDGTIYRPNEDLEDNVLSTHTKVQLADGSQAFVVPENSSKLDSLKFVWRGIVVADGLIAKIKDYIDGDDQIKITTHLSEVYTGRFINMTKTHATGQEDIWDVEANFDRL